MAKYRMTFLHALLAMVLGNVLLPAEAVAATVKHKLATLTDTTQKAVLFGPLPATDSMDLRSLTFANTGGGAKLEVRVRGILPSNPSDCLGAGTVIDETTWISVDDGDTVHLDYPLQLHTPNTTPAGPWCLIVFFPPSPPFQTIPAGAEVRVTAVGTQRP
jgi:hypothetical protein